MTAKDKEHNFEMPGRILAVAAQMFMEHGYRAVSTRQIADACGITQPALYHHFKNKQALYVEVCRNTLKENEIALLEIIRNHASFKERMRESAIYMLQNYQDDLSQMFHDIFNELDESSREMLHGLWLRGFLQPIVNMIEDGVANGEIKKLETLDTTPVEVGFLILNFIKSSMEPALLKRIPEDRRNEWIAKKANLIVEVFCSGLGQ